MIAPLIADGGEMTVLRQLATYTWGTWSVTWPEGIDPPELPDEREFGFVSKLAEPTGRFARRFDRADVSIDVENEFSDVEFVLDEAAGRMAGDAFFERDITNAGLGRQVPLVDFSIGDVVPVLIWGKVIDLPVTSIERVSEVGNAVGWRVHVGGQLLGDSVGLDQGNREIYRQIAQERRERIGDVAAVDQKAEVAKGTAEEAKGTADDAKSVADDALAAVGDADGVIQGYVEEGRQHVVDALGHADDARGNAENAFSEAERAVGLVADASLIIDQAQEKLDTIPAIIESGRRWAQLSAAQSASSQAFASQALVHADKADEHAQTALRLVDDALVLVDAADAALDVIEVELGKIPGLIAEGEQHVENAKGHADRADQAVTDAGVAKTDAEAALANATNLLADIDGEGTDFPTAVTQVLGAHNDVLTKHDEVLTKHGEAIAAANNSAREAGAAAQSALDAGTALGLIQIEMMEVDRLQNRAIRAVAGAAAQASMAAMQAAETGRLAAKAADEAGKAAGSAGKAADDALDAAEVLATVQILHGEALTKHGQAIKAVAGAAGQAAMAAMRATETARSAALAADSALDAIDAMKLAQTARQDAQDIAMKDQTDRIIFQEESLAKISDMQKRLSRATTRMLEVQRGDVLATDDCWQVTITLDAMTVRFEPVASAPTWAGKCVAEIRVWKPGSGTSVTNESRIVRKRWNGSPSSATQTYQIEDGYFIESVMLLYNYSEGEFKTSGNSGGPVTIDEKTSYTFGTFTAPAAGNYTVSASTLWPNVREGAVHECSISRAGWPLITDSQKFHQNSRNVRIAPVPRTLSLAAGEKISFTAWTNAPYTTYRSIEWEWSVTWLAPVSI